MTPKAMTSKATAKTPKAKTPKAKTASARRPAAFTLDDPALRVAPEREIEFDAIAEPSPSRAKASKAPASGTQAGSVEAPPPAIARVPFEPLASRRGWRWGRILLSSLAGLVTLSLGLWVADLVDSLFARADWLGWTALGAAALAGLAVVAIAAREIGGLMRLSRISHLQIAAERARAEQEIAAARQAVSDMRTLYRTRPDMAWPLERFDEQADEIFDADGYLDHAERTLLKALDAHAAQEASRAAKRVAIVTAVSPAALIDVGFVLATNVRLIRRIAMIYGGRPGFLGLARLARNTIAHLTVTGGLALGDGVIQQVLGHGLAARLSARFGEGVVNGLFTTRIALAAIEVCRPMPFHALKAPTIKSIAAGLASLGKGGGEQSDRA